MAEEPTNCPKCGAAQPEGALECARCGIVFARWQRLHDPDAPPPPQRPVPQEGAAPAAGEEEGTPAIEREGWIALATGFGLALLIYLIPLTRFLLSYLAVLVHELGHAIVSWLFGYPALPAFDFLFGGGFTPTWERSTILRIAVYAGIAALFWLYRRNGAALVALAVLTLLYSIAAITQAHQVVILLAGHGSELVFAGIFLFRAMKGSAILHKVERPLYAMAGFFLLFGNLALAHRLVTSEEARIAYEEAKGGGAWMDFSQIARDFLHVELPTTALIFLPMILATPVVAWLVFRHEARLRRLLLRLLALAP